MLRRLFLLLLAVYAYGQSSETFESFKARMEGLVEDLARSYSEAFEDRCSVRNLNCEDKAHYSCQGTSRRRCFQETPTPA